MPYKVVSVKKNGKRIGYKIYNQDSGQIVAGANKPLDKKGMRGYLYHAGKSDNVGPGGHVPDGTGPHGRGMGPGAGRGDGSGLKKRN